MGEELAMSTHELVVARYREDLAWLRRVPSSFRITVYDKGGDFEGGISLENVGYEAHSYLHHIVERYDDLATTTVFVQGHPFDHVPRLHRRLQRLADGTEAVADFFWMGFVADFDDARGDRLFRTWSKNRDGRGLELDAFCRALWQEPAPERFVFYPGAQFCLRRELILRQPRSFYARALELSRDFPDAGHCFERSWDRVFGVNGLPGPLRGQDLPIYLRPIRRLGITWDDIPEAWRELG
jgi:Protein of unknown function (DUF3431)